MKIVAIDEERHPTIAMSSRVIAVAEAVLGWLLAVVALLLGARPLGLILGVAAGLTLLMALAQALGRRESGGRVRLVEHLALALVSIMLVWPVLAVTTVVVLSYAGTLKWE